MSQSIEEAFGGEFFNQYKEALKKTRVKRLIMDKPTKNEIIQLVKSNMKGDAPQMNYLKNGMVYHVLLADTPGNLNIREMTFGVSVSFRWKGNWVSAIMQKEDVDKIAPSTAYLLVGYLKTKTGQDGRIFYNLTTHGVITMEEIAKFTQNMEADRVATEMAQGTVDEQAANAAAAEEEPKEHEVSE
jgi:hypothetical protein